jgi:hypothetical protein
MTGPVECVVGPGHHVALYAAGRGWRVEDYHPVSTVTALKSIDPVTIAGFTMVRTEQLDTDEMNAIVEEVRKIRALWPAVPVAVET